MITSRTLGVVRGVPYTMRKVSIADGEGGVRQTVRHMQAFVNGPEGIGAPAVRAAALDAVRGFPESQEIEKIFQWVKNNIEFRGEAEETLQTPLVTLQLKAGDCDDQTALVAAMLKSLGYQVEIKTVAVERDDPNLSTHVYAVVKDKKTKQWIPLDTTVGTAFAGWEPQDITRPTMYPLNSQARGMRGLRGVRRPVRGMRVRRTLRRLGDDISATDVVPMTTDQPLTAGQAIAFNLAAPFAQAGASLLAYGQTVSPASAQAAAAAANSTMVWVLGIGVLVIGGIFALKGSR